MKIGIVVQRYGADINGGAELHARYVAEHLAKHVHVEVLTTCATDYITWRNSLPATVDTVRGVTVRRFPVAREREPAEFGRWSDRVFLQPHAFNDELAWLEAEGPTSPELTTYVRDHASAFDFFIFFSFRYYHAYHGARGVPQKAILVPTAERDGALGLVLFGAVFRGVRAIMYNSFEERALIHAVADNGDVPGVVVGVGSEIPAETRAAHFRQKHSFHERFAIYVGRIDENKGCAELFDHFDRYSRMLADGVHLVLVGTPVLPIPDHPRIHHVGFLADQEKFDAIAAAELLIMPSYFESLSMVALEAWALGKPVLANGRCDVLKGQCIRSNGGLFYESFEEFLETLRAIDSSPALAAALGRNGREYFKRHYAWPVIERKYLEMIERLLREPAAARMEPLPGWFARRRRNLPPAVDVLARLPVGPALGDRDDRDRAQPSTPATPREPARAETAPERSTGGRGGRAAPRAPAESRPARDRDRRPRSEPRGPAAAGGDPRPARTRPFRPTGAPDAGSAPAAPRRVPRAASRRPRRRPPDR